MNFADFYGLGALTERLRADVNAGTGVHAYLFVGPRGTGKRSMAQICARALHCAGAQKPCDGCPPCARHLSGTHPDLIRLSKSGNIGVDEVRELIARVMIKPFEGVRHVVILEDADNMTPQAQNALLKTLESPPSGAVFFLIAGSTAKLLPTIQSRCRIIRFHEIDEQCCVEALRARGIEAERAGLLARLSGGAVGVALELDRDKDYWSLRDKVLSVLASVRSSADIGEAALRLKDDKDEAATVLAILEQHGREQMLEEQLSGAGAGAIPGDRLLRSVLRARERQASNVVWHNNLETLFWDLVA